MSEHDLTSMFQAAGVNYWTDGANVGRDYVNIQCVFCDDQSNHLGIHVEEYFYRCFRCEARGGWGSLANKLKQEYPTVDWFSIGKDEAPHYLDVKKFERKRKTPKEVQAWTRAFNNSKHDDGVWDWLTVKPSVKDFDYEFRERGIHPDLIDTFGIEVGIKKLAGYVTFPVQNNLIARRWRKRKRDEIGVYTPRWWQYKAQDSFLFGEDIVKDSNPDWLVITEGVFDVFAFPPGFALAILGSTSQAGWQSRLIDIAPNPNKIILALDKDAVNRGKYTQIMLELRDVDYDVVSWPWREFEVNDLDEARLVYGQEKLLDTALDIVRG